MYILGASVFVKAKESIPCIALGWETVNYNLCSGGSELQSQASSARILFTFSQRDLSADIVLWHDVISNSVSKHDSTHNTELTTGNNTDLLPDSKQLSTVDVKGPLISSGHFAKR